MSIPGSVRSAGTPLGVLLLTLALMASSSAQSLAQGVPVVPKLMNCDVVRSGPGCALKSGADGRRSRHGQRGFGIGRQIF